MKRSTLDRLTAPAPYGRLDAPLEPLAQTQIEPQPWPGLPVAVAAFKGLTGRDPRAALLAGEPPDGLLDDLRAAPSELRTLVFGGRDGGPDPWALRRSKRAAVEARDVALTLLEGRGDAVAFAARAASAGRSASDADLAAPLLAAVGQLGPDGLPTGRLRDALLAAADRAEAAAERAEELYAGLAAALEDVGRRRFKDLTRP